MSTPECRGAVADATWVWRDVRYILIVHHHRPLSGEVHEEVTELEATLAARQAPCPVGAVGMCGGSSTGEGGGGGGECGYSRPCGGRSCNGCTGGGSGGCGVCGCGYVRGGALRICVQLFQSGRGRVRGAMCDVRCAMCDVRCAVGCLSVTWVLHGGSNKGLALPMAQPKPPTNQPCCYRTANYQPTSSTKSCTPFI